MVMKGLSDIANRGIENEAGRKWPCNGGPGFFYFYFYFYFRKVVGPGILGSLEVDHTRSVRKNVVQIAGGHEMTGKANIEIVRQTVSNRKRRWAEVAVVSINNVSRSFEVGEFH